MSASDSHDKPSKPSLLAVDPILALGLGSISFACLLWLNFMTFAVTDGVGFALYPASEHALLFMWGIALCSQSPLARGSHQPLLPLNGPALLPLAATISALIAVAVVYPGRNPLLLTLTWLALAIALLMAAIAALSTKVVLAAPGSPNPQRPIVGSGLLLGWLGAILMALSYLLPTHGAVLVVLAKLLVFDALPQLVLLGLLQRGFPVAAPLLTAALFLASVVTEALGSPVAAYGVRAVAIGGAFCAAAFASRRLPADDQPSLRFWRWLLASSWLGGTIAIAIWPQLAIHLKHFIYFGVTLTLTALVLAAPLRFRVALMTRKRFNWVVGLVALGAVTRATAFVSHSSYTRHLGYAALIVLVAMSLAVFAYRHPRP